MQHSVVITTINPPTDSIERMARGAGEHGWQVVIAGDTKTPDAAYRDRQDLTYLSYDQQGQAGWALAGVIPAKTYARKMFGYLHAMRAAPDFLIDTDDDNWPLADFFQPRNDLRFAGSETGECLAFDGCGWVNIYQHFSPASTIWPRGYPLSRIGDGLPLAQMRMQGADSLIYQGLAEGAPDVDAVHRLVFPHQEYAFNRAAPLEIRDGAWCPFNSQNTTWRPEAFVLMYLPFTCSFRMTDIYRGYIAQRIVQQMGHGVLFHHATMHQDRNLHSIIGDFRDEVMCYTDDGAFMAGLAALDLTGQSPAGMLITCYDFAVQQGYVEPSEMDGVRAWISDLETLGVLS